MPGLEFRRLLSFLISVALIAMHCMMWSATLAAEDRRDSAAPAESSTPAVADADATSEDGPESAQQALCAIIERAAADHGLPVGFFTRLIWKESRFRSEAVSPKGAQGIAQFMPGTAAERGLEDPFDVSTAIPASAHFLAELRDRFGNLGLAAAAYNAGPERVSNWLAEDATLPFETQNFVIAITGVAADTWADPEANATLPAEPEDAKDCLALAALLRGPGAELSPQIETASAPWGVQVAGSYSRSLVIGAFAKLQARFPALFADRDPMIIGGRMPGRGSRAFYRLRVPVQTRADGEKFCSELRKAGGTCIVLKT